MILDHLDNLDRYTHVLNTALIKKAIGEKYYEQVDSGKFSIDEEAFFGIRLSYVTKDASNGLWEAHRKYLDIHVVLEGTEIIQINDIAKMKETQAYDIENDYALFEGVPHQNVVLTKGTFLVLYPNEVHKTAVQVNEESMIRKVVFKEELR